MDSQYYFIFKNSLSLSLIHFYRNPKRHRELRKCLKKSCEGLRVHERMDSCCHVLNVFLTKEFDKQLACAIEDIVQKVRASKTYPIPMQADRLCDLAEELSTRTKILFLRNKETPKKSWIVLDIDMLLSKINGRIFAPESLPEHCLTPTHTGVLPWSQIQRHLPDLDPSLVVSFLGRLEFCQVVQDPEVLSLIKFGKNDASSIIDSDEESGSPVSSHRRSLCSQMSISSSQTYSSSTSAVSSHTTGSTERDGYPPSFSRKEPRDGLPPNWVGNLYLTKPSQGYLKGVSSHISDSQLSISSGISSMSNCTTGGSVLSEQDAIPPLHNWMADLYSLNALEPPQYQTSVESNAVSKSVSTQAMQPHQSSHQYDVHTADTSLKLKDSSLFPIQIYQEDTSASIKQLLQHKQELSQRLHSPRSTINTSSAFLPTVPPESQVFSSPAGSGTGGLLSPLDARPPLHHPSSVSHSLPNHSHFNDQHESRRQTSSPPQYSQASKLHDQIHNLHLGRATGGIQPSLPEEQTRLAGGRQFGSMHRSPSDSCTLSSGRPQHQCNTRARSQDDSPRMLHHTGRTQRPVFDDKFLFFPGLVNSGQPSGEMWLKDESFVFYSGWCLESAQPHKFFTPRFLQTLLLRLTFGFAVSRRSNVGVLTSSVSLFSHECTIWKSGLRWLNLDGVETFVEMVEDGRALLLLMRAKKGSELRGVSLRSALIQKILDTKEEFCPDMPTSEYLIHPKHLRERESYPIITAQLSRLIRYDVSIVAQAIVAENRRRPCKLI